MMDKKELYKKVEDLDLFCLGIRKYVALSEVMYLIKQLDEPQKVVIPQYVADWIEYCKRNSFTLFGCFDPVNMFESLVGEDFEGDARKCIRWCRKESSTFALAWLNGYKIEQYKKYLVQLRGVKCATGVLKCISNRVWYMGDDIEYENIKVYHTKEELEAGGFGEVFDNPMFEVVEEENE